MCKAVGKTLDEIGEESLESVHHMMEMVTFEGEEARRHHKELERKARQKPRGR